MAARRAWCEGILDLGLRQTSFNATGLLSGEAKLDPADSTSDHFDERGGTTVTNDNLAEWDRQNCFIFVKPIERTTNRLVESSSFQSVRQATEAGLISREGIVSKHTAK